MSDTYEGAWIFGNHNGIPVHAYEVEVGRALAERNQYCLVAQRRGIAVEELRREISGSRDPHWLRRADEAIMRMALAAGYDAILYTEPTTPLCGRELVVFDPRRCSLLGECAPDGAVYPSGVAPASGTTPGRS